MSLKNMKPKNIESIQTKILLLTILPVLIVAIFITAINLFYLEKEMNSFLEAAVDNESESLLQKMENEINYHKIIALNISEIYKNEGSKLKKSDYEEILKNFLRLNENTLGAGIWLEPYKYSETQMYFGPYVYKDESGYIYTEEYEDEDYNYHDKEWYSRSKENQDGTVWTGPYYDEVTGIDMITLSVPIFFDGNFGGVASADYDLRTIESFVKSSSSETIDEMFIIDKDKNIVALSNEFEYKNEILEMISWDDPEEESVKVLDEVFTVYSRILPNADWKLILISSQNQIEAAKKSVILRSVIGTGFIIILMILLIYIFIHKLSEKISEFENKISYLAKGDFSHKVSINSNDELGRIGRHYNTVLDELAEYDRKLKESENLLRGTNEELEAYSEELLATEEELRNHYEMLLVKDAELTKSDNYKKAIIKAIPDIIFIFSREGEFLDCQANDDNLLLYPREMFLGKNIKDIFPPRISIRAIEKINAAVVTGELQEFDYELDIEDRREYFEIRMTRTESGNVLGIVRDVTYDKLNLERIEYLSYRDQLTGLYNRRFFEEELKRLDNKRNLPLAIIMADVNGLKLVNDSFGHQAGDELLVKFSNILRNTCRASEIISRIGGDEFVILLPNMTADDTNNLVKRIIENGKGEKVNSIDISVSFGYAVKENEDESIIDVLNQSENEMYKRKLFESPSMRGKTINAIITTLNEKNVREELHSRRVSEYCGKIADVLRFSDGKINEMKTVGLLHDIGKIAIREYLLNKPGKLTEDEYLEIQRHPEIGYRILSTVNDMAEMATYVLSHHERWDGKGYPRGLSGKDIPIESRIIAIADAYDAMTAYRSYKTEMTKEEAIEELKKNAGSQFDPDITEIFIKQVLSEAK